MVNLLLIQSNKVLDLQYVVWWDILDPVLGPQLLFHLQLHRQEKVEQSRIIVFCSF